MFAFIVKAIHLLVCLLLIVIVLFQADKGEGLSGAFGGGASATIFGERGAETQLSKMTTWIAVVFMVTSLILAVFGPEWDRKAVADRLNNESWGTSETTNTALPTGSFFPTTGNVTTNQTNIPAPTSTSTPAPVTNTSAAPAQTNTSAMPSVPSLPPVAPITFGTEQNTTTTTQAEPVAPATPNQAVVESAKPIVPVENPIPPTTTNNPVNNIPGVNE